MDELNNCGRMPMKFIKIIGEMIDNKIELIKDIAKKSVVFLSFTQDDGNEFYCYLHNIIKDGAMYYVGENYGEIDCDAVEAYDVNELDCWCENIEDEYSDVDSMAEQLVKDFVEGRWEEYEYDGGAMSIDDEYVITICVDGKKVFERTVFKAM